MTKQMTVDKHLRRHLKARAKTGQAKYGVPLLPFNGRNPLKDKREELLDALVYNEQDIIERENMAVELEEVHGFLYNFRQSREIESADLDRAIAALAKMAARLTEDTERIEPKKRELTYWGEANVCNEKHDEVRPVWADASVSIPREITRRMFGPDAPPEERPYTLSRGPETVWTLHEAVGACEGHEMASFTIPLEPVMESIRKDGPIGKRDLLAMTQKEDERLYKEATAGRDLKAEREKMGRILLGDAEERVASAVVDFMIGKQHPAMERLEQMECKCCGKCVKA